MWPLLARFLEQATAVANAPSTESPCARWFLASIRSQLRKRQLLCLLIRTPPLGLKDYSSTTGWKVRMCERPGRLQLSSDPAGNSARWDWNPRLGKHKCVE